jgi:hypothetical protein
VDREVGHPSVEDHQHQEEGLIIETNKQTRGIMRISFQTTKECKTKQKKKEKYFTNQSWLKTYPYVVEHQQRELVGQLQEDQHVVEHHRQL